MKCINKQLLWASAYFLHVSRMVLKNKNYSRKIYECFDDAPDDGPHALWIGGGVTLEETLHIGIETFHHRMKVINLY